MPQVQKSSKNKEKELTISSKIPEISKKISKNHPASTFTLFFSMSLVLEREYRRLAAHSDPETWAHVALAGLKGDTLSNKRKFARERAGIISKVLTELGQEKISKITPDTRDKLSELLEKFL